MIVSNNISNKFLERFQVIPLSSQIGKLYPTEVLLRVNGKSSKAMADQLTTVSSLRFLDKLGEVSTEELKTIERVIKLQLGL